MVRGSELCKPEEKVENCLVAMKELKDFPSYPNSSLRGELAERCAKIEAGWKCVDSFQQRCLQNEGKINLEKLYNGSRKAVKEICQEEIYQEKYLKNAECINKAADKIIHCQKKHNVTGLGELYVMNFNSNTTNFDLTESSKTFCW